MNAVDTESRDRERHNALSIVSLNILCRFVSCRVDSCDSFSFNLIQPFLFVQVSTAVNKTSSLFSEYELYSMVPVVYEYEWSSDT